MKRHFEALNVIQQTALCDAVHRLKRLNARSVELLPSPATEDELKEKVEAILTVIDDWTQVQSGFNADYTEEFLWKEEIPDWIMISVKNLCNTIEAQNIQPSEDSKMHDLLNGEWSY